MALFNAFKTGKFIASPFLRKEANGTQNKK
jgi:hypothetical protein